MAQSLSTQALSQTLSRAAKVILLHKADAKDIITNYRPILILPYFSKYFEKAIYSRTVSFFDKFSIIKDDRFSSTSLDLYAPLDHPIKDRPQPGTGSIQNWSLFGPG